MPAVKKMIRHPVTGKRMKRVFVVDKGWYGWNTAYHVYNHVTNYKQLQQEEAVNVDFIQSSLG
jgi:hypothetical protein